MTNIGTCYAPGTVGLQVFPKPIIKSRNPATTDNNYALGQVWINDIANIVYMLTEIAANVANWVAIGAGTGGSLQTLTGTTGGALSPVGGTIIITGNSGQGVSVGGAGHTLTATVADWTTAQKGVGVLSTNAQAVTGTGTTQAVTPAALTARLASPGTIGGTAPGAGNFTTALISDGSTTTFINGGNVSVGKHLVVLPAGGSIGTSSAMIAGTVTVNSSIVHPTSYIFLTVNTPGGTQGVLSAPTASIVDGVSFVINSSNALDTSTVNWWII